MAHLDNTQMFANAGAINSERTTAAPEIELPEVGSRWMVKENKEKPLDRMTVIASNSSGIALDGKLTHGNFTPQQWSQLVQTAGAVHVPTKRELRRQRKADARLDREINGIRNRSAVNYVTFTGRKSLPKRIFKYVLSRSGWYTLGGLTGHLAASAILSGVAYLASLWAQYIVAK